MGFPHKPHPKETVVLSQHFGDADARTVKGAVPMIACDRLLPVSAADPR